MNGSKSNAEQVAQRIRYLIRAWHAHDSRSQCLPYAVGHSVLSVGCLLGPDPTLLQFKCQQKMFHRFSEIFIFLTGLENPFSQPDLKTLIFHISALHQNLKLLDRPVQFSFCTRTCCSSNSCRRCRGCSELGHIQDTIREPGCTERQHLPADRYLPSSLPTDSTNAHPQIYKQYPSRSVMFSKFYYITIGCLI